MVDRGPGIPADQREEVFAPFQRLGDTDNATGVGLGLALSRGLAEAMGGTLRARGHPGRRPHDGGAAARAQRCTARQPARGAAPGARDRPSADVTRVLVVDDEPPSCGRCASTCAPAATTSAPRPTAPRRSREAAAHQPELVVLDLGLPDLDGTEVIAGLRGWTSVPVLVLSGRSDSADKVEALDAGADDYVTKPFGMDELLARMRALLRRAGRRATSPPVVEFGDATVDLAARRVDARGSDVRLTPTEWHLLEVLRAPPRHACSRQARLLAEVWGPGYETAHGNLRLYVGQLRKKLEPDPARPRHLLTEPGMGYRFEPRGRPGGP